MTQITATYVGGPLDMQVRKVELRPEYAVPVFEPLRLWFEDVIEDPAMPLGKIAFYELQVLTNTYWTNVGMLNSERHTNNEYRYIYKGENTPMRAATLIEALYRMPAGATVNAITEEGTTYITIDHEEYDAERAHRMAKINPRSGKVMQFTTHASEMPLRGF